jgi:hypothetical protein
VASWADDDGRDRRVAARRPAKGCWTDPDAIVASLLSLDVPIADGGRTFLTLILEPAREAPGGTRVTRGSPAGAAPDAPGSIGRAERRHLA